MTTHPLFDPAPYTDTRLLLDVVEAANLLHVSRTTIYTLMAQGHLRPIHIGRACRIPRTELDRYITTLTAGAEEPGSVATP